jgi:hypothetical protein
MFLKAEASYITGNLFKKDIEEIRNFFKEKAYLHLYEEQSNGINIFIRDDGTIKKLRFINKDKYFTIEEYQIEIRDITIFSKIKKVIREYKLSAELIQYFNDGPEQSIRRKIIYKLINGETIEINEKLKYSPSFFEKLLKDDTIEKEIQSIRKEIDCLLEKRIKEENKDLVDKKLTELSKRIFLLEG